MLQYIVNMNDCIIYVGSTISFASLGYGIICSIYDPTEGTGYLANAASSALCTYCYKHLVINKSIAKSAESLKHLVKVLQQSEQGLKESEECLKSHNLDLANKISSLESNVSFFNDCNQRLEDDIEMLKATVGLAGERGEMLIKQLREVHHDIKLENIKQKTLVKRQTCLHICQLMQHLDSNNDAFLDEKELDAARSYLKMMIPNLNLDDLENSMVDGRLNLTGLLNNLPLS